MRRQGFTLVEVLVVVAILSLLATLTVGTVQRSLNQGLLVQSQNQLRQLVAANLNFAISHGHFVPADDQANLGRWHGARASVQAPFDPAAGFLADYLGNSRQVTRCPLFQRMLRGNASFEDGTGGYGYNSTYIGGWPGRGFDANGRRVAARPEWIQHPRTVMFATSAYASGGSVQEYGASHPPFWDFGNGPTRHRPSPSTHFRFGGRALVGWMDGSASTVAMDPRAVGSNPHGGDAQAHQLGWFGPDEENGFWNPMRSRP